MMKNTKEQIIESTIRLLKAEKKVSKVSMRKIASDVGIAVSVINYHFQTKDKLINQAIDQYISNVISSASKTFDMNNLTVEEKIRLHIKNAVDFIANNPAIARVSILNDLQNGHVQDNSSHLFYSIVKQLEDYYQDEKNTLQIQLLAQQQIATVQEIFLRHEIFQQQTGLDFFDKQDREVIVDQLINNILNK